MGAQTNAPAVGAARGAGSAAQLATTAKFSTGAPPLALHGADRLGAPGPVVIHGSPEAADVAHEAGLRGAHLALPVLADPREVGMAPLRGRQVVVVQDAPAGDRKLARAEAEAIAEAARAAGGRVRVIRLPALAGALGVVGDVGEWFQAGGTLAAWRELLEPGADDGETLPPAPPGYRLTRSGVLARRDDGNDERLTHAAVFISAVSRDGGRENWGFLVEWVDRDGEHHERAIPAGNLHEQGNGTAQELANAGLAIVPGKERALLRYLAAFSPARRLTAATATGWTGEAFVLPERTINAPPESAIVFQPPTHHAAADAICAAGSLDNWQREVAEPAGAADLPGFMVSAALAAPLFHLAGLEGGGFHLFGTTSRGKTTALQAAASVWGCGADPASAGAAGAFVERWNMTANATEGLAESRNDLPLILDEIGETEARDFGRTLYRIVSGSGKARATRDGGSRKRRSWRTLILSAGEVRVAHHIREGGGTVRGGQLVRLAELPAESIFSDARAADAMKRACARHYGTAGPAFVEHIAADLGGIREEIAALEIIAERVGEATGNEAARVRKRFALVALAGELAIKAGVLPWKPGRALEAARAMFAAWAGAQDAPTDAGRGIANLRAFILAHGASRFEREDERRPVNNRAGWYRDGRYHFTPAAFAEACGGAQPETVKKALRDDQILVTDAYDRLRNRIHVGNQRVDVVTVKAEILEQAGPGIGLTGAAPGPAETRVDKGPAPVAPVSPAGNTSPAFARGQGGG